MGFGKRGRRGNTLTAIAFTADQIRVAQLRGAPGERPALVSWGAFASQGGEPGALKRLRAAGHLGDGRRLLLLRNGEYQLVQAPLPDVPEAEVRDALRWRLKDLVQFPVDQAGLDYLPMPGIGGSREAQAYVAVATREVLTARVRLFQDAKVDLDIIDIPEFAQRNLSGLFELANRGLAMLIFDDDGGRLTFTYQGELYVTRRIEVKPVELAGADAAPGGLYERVLLDVQRSLDNFDRNYSTISLTRLLVAPFPGAAGFIEYLKSNLYQAVEVLDLGEQIDLSLFPALAEPVAQGPALLAIGAALRDGAESVRS